MARYDVAVIGLGRFGSALALRLVEEGRRVLGVDVDEAAVTALADQVDHQMNDPAVIRAQIDELDAAFERGEITEDDRDEQQEVLLQRLVGGGGA